MFSESGVRACVCVRVCVSVSGWLSGCLRGACLSSVCICHRVVLVSLSLLSVFLAQALADARRAQAEGADAKSGAKGRQGKMEKTESKRPAKRER